MVFVEVARKLRSKSSKRARRCRKVRGGSSRPGFLLCDSFRPFVEVSLSLTTFRSIREVSEAFRLFCVGSKSFQIECFSVCSVRSLSWLAFDYLKETL